MTTHHTTILRVAVHTSQQNPDHGEGVTHIAIEDEGAGAYLVISQPVPMGPQENGISLDLSELDAVHAAAHKLMQQDAFKEGGQP